MFRKTSFYFLFIALLMMSFGCSNESDRVEITVAAASSLTDALQDIKTSFEKERPDVTVRYQFGSSGKLATQIMRGAPSDVFLSASEKDMDELRQHRLIDENSRVNFAQNKLVLIAPADHSFKLSSFEEIDADQVNHFAIGEPESVPVGRYTKEALRHLRLWEPLQSKLVMGSSARQTLTYVESGNAEIGVVYATDALISDQVAVLAEWDPSGLEPIHYPAAIIANSPRAQEAQAFLSHLTSKTGKQILKQYGFD